MNEMCGDNRFEIIARAKKHLLDATNIDTSADEMKVLDDFLYRCWQMGWLDRYDTADTLQTDLVKDSDGLVKDLVKDTPQTESTGSPIGDYRDGVGAWQTERMTEEEIDTMLAKALVGQTDCGWGKPTTVGSDEDKEV